MASITHSLATFCSGGNHSTLQVTVTIGGAGQSISIPVVRRLLTDPLTEEEKEAFAKVWAKILVLDLQAQGVAQNQWRNRVNNFTATVSP